ncbi:hypothetical protein T01_5286 [Trichinella spiralis]|uniref:Uncharacterized protein n=1 Tax=Trichinella spiralis TaxID=6334 RepID=A0A0V1B9U4_TRISP|nr:hypothetical protein T01_5286 [Trichinella spiralis]
MMSSHCQAAALPKPLAQIKLTERQQGCVFKLSEAYELNAFVSVQLKSIVQSCSMCNKLSNYAPPITAELSELNE